MQDIFGRFLKLYVPYILMVIVLIIFMFSSHGQFPSWNEISGWLLIFNQNSDGWPVVMGSIWFLTVFICIMPFTPILRYISQYRNASLLYLIISIIFIGLFSSNSEFLNYSIYPTVSLRLLIFYSVFYFLGIYTAQISISKRSGFKIICVLSVFVIADSINNGGFMMQENKFPPTLIYFAASMISIIIVLIVKNYESNLSKWSNSSMGSFLTYSGKNVFYIYLFQGFGASALYYLIPYYSQFHWIFVLFLSYIINIVITYLLVVIISFVDRKLYFLYKN
ncbi:hypothetical protein VE23_15010 [Paenibacillus sp. D9]|nr:hypothetical protein VE23_15010 [Paenibacillus sp. D9]